jgi:hypothetical protein
LNNRIAYKRFTDLHADPFMNVLFRLVDIYRSLGEPFVAPLTPQSHGFNVKLTPQWRLNPLCQFPKPKKTVLQSIPRVDTSTFIQWREEAHEATTKIVMRWERAGVESKQIWTALKKINPGKKRCLTDLALDHERIVSTIESQREACFHLAMMAHPDTHFIVFPSQLRTDIKHAAMAGMEACTKALTKLEEGTRIIESAKHQYIHERSPLLSAAITDLRDLRRRHVQESRSETANRIAQLLNAWAPRPEKPWNGSSIRAGYLYRKS